MRVSLVAPLLATAAAVAIPASEAGLIGREATIQAWEVSPTTFDIVPEPIALHEKPQNAKDAAAASKREADVVCLPISKPKQQFSIYSHCLRKWN
jgi:hypothetical protein